jgi:hypothetical protein
VDVVDLSEVFCVSEGFFFCNLPAVFFFSLFHVFMGGLVWLRMGGWESGDLRMLVHPLRVDLG